MKIKFNVNKDRVLFINENASEYKNLHNFPGFIQEGPHFYSPALVPVVYNLISRVQSTFKKVVVDADVFKFANQEFSLSKLPEDFVFYTSPLDFQEIALRYLYTMGSGGLCIAPGMGKSKIVLDYIHLKKFPMVLLICPLPLTSVWVDEVSKHRPELSIHVVETTDWDKEWELGKDKTIFCLNYTKAVLLEAGIKKQRFDFIHLDEALIKDPTTTRTKVITELAKNIPYRCLGSGTLINNSVLDVFAPVRFLSPSLVGRNYSSFLNRYTVKNPRDLRMVVGYRKVDEARAILESAVIVMDKENWLKLPPKVFHDIWVEPSQDQLEVSKCLSRNYIANYAEETIEIDNALVMMAKLYQISQGFFYISDKTDDELDLLELTASEEKSKRKKSPRRTVFFKEQPKIKALVSLINNEVKGKRCILWFNSNAEYDLIKDCLTLNCCSFLTIRGGTKKIGEVVREFNNSPNIRFLVCQAKSVNYGLTILGTSYEKLENAKVEIMPGVDPSVHTQIFYSCNFSLEVFLQQVDRCHRIGQIYECHYFRLWLDTPVERSIKLALSTKMDVRKELLIDIAETLRQ